MPNSALPASADQPPSRPGACCTACAAAHNAAPTSSPPSSPSRPPPAHEVGKGSVAELSRSAVGDNLELLGVDRAVHQPSVLNHSLVLSLPGRCPDHEPERAGRSKVAGVK